MVYSPLVLVFLSLITLWNGLVQATGTSIFYSYQIPTPPNASYFGFDSAMYETRAAISGFQSNRGTVFLYDLVEGVWSYSALITDDAFDAMTAVAFKSTDVLIVSVLYGRVYQYEFVNENWSLQSSFRLPYTGAYKFSISGDNMVIGNVDYHSVYWYKYVDSAWSLQHSLTNADFLDVGFGYGVGIDGDVVMVTSEQIQVYDISSGQMELQTTLHCGYPVKYVTFDNTLGRGVVTAEDYESVLFTITKNGKYSWSFDTTKYTNPIDGDDNDYFFGQGSSLSGSEFITGSWAKDGAKGHMYAFSFNPPNYATY